MNDERTAGIGLAYDFVLPSYGWALQRLEASAARLQNVQTYAATVTLAAPVIVKGINPSASLNSAWFFAALALFCAIGILALVSHLDRRGVVLIDPGNLTGDDWLALPAEEFKLEMVKAAGRHFDQNARLIQRRAGLSDFLTVLFVIEVALLATWASAAL